MDRTKSLNFLFQDNERRILAAALLLSGKHTPNKKFELLPGIWCKEMTEGIIVPEMSILVDGNNSYLGHDILISRLTRTDLQVCIRKPNEHILSANNHWFLIWEI